jgi:hypothetical protein
MKRLRINLTLPLSATETVANKATPAGFVPDITAFDLGDPVIGQLRLQGPTDCVWIEQQSQSRKAWIAFGQ